MWSLSGIKPLQNSVCIYYFLFNLVRFSLIPLYHYPQIQWKLHKPPEGYAPAIHREGLCSIPGPFGVGFVLSNVALKQVFPRIILFFPTSIASSRQFTISETDSLSWITHLKNMYKPQNVFFMSAYCIPLRAKTFFALRFEIRLLFLFFIAWDFLFNVVESRLNHNSSQWVVLAVLYFISVGRLAHPV
jgi:hypothetical protein